MSKVKSEINMNEAVDNKEHKFGEADVYFPCYINTAEGTVAALFTKDQLEVAIERATKNIEDIDPGKEGGLFDWLF